MFFSANIYVQGSSSGCLIFVYIHLTKSTPWICLSDTMLPGAQQRELNAHCLGNDRPLCLQLIVSFRKIVHLPWGWFLKPSEHSVGGTFPFLESQIISMKKNNLLQSWRLYCPPGERDSSHLSYWRAEWNTKFQLDICVSQQQTSTWQWSKKKPSSNLCCLFSVLLQYPFFLCSLSIMKRGGVYVEGEGL